MCIVTLYVNRLTVKEDWGQKWPSSTFLLSEVQ